MLFLSFSCRRAFAGLWLLLAHSPMSATAASADASVAAPASPAAKPETTPELAIAASREALQKEIARTRAEFDRLATDQPEETALRLTQEIVLLARLDGLHAEHLRTLQHGADLAKESAETTALAQNPRPPEVRYPPPHGLALLDQLYGERDYLTQAKTLLETDVDNATAALADARDELDDVNRRRRAAKESAADQASGALRLAELETRLATETVALCETALANLKLQRSLVAPKLALLLPNLAWLHEHLVVSEADLVSAKLRRDARIAELDAALTVARVEAEKVGRLVVVTERRKDQTTAASNDELESRRADRQTVHLLLSTLAMQRERLAAFAEVLDLRVRALAAAGPTPEMKTWAEANDTALDRLKKARRPRFADLRKSRKELQDLRAQLAAPATPGRDQPWVADRVRHLSAWVAVNERELADLAELTTARERLKEELGEHVATFSLHDSFASAWAGVGAAWNHEVFSVADQPVRVNTLLVAVALILAGHWASRRASTLIGRVVFHRLGMNTGRRAAWQTLSFYGLFLIVLLTASNLIHLSLTQFSVVSGALAVGLGFGSQNLIGNFISGIILLVERPVNEGDVIEIEGRQMTVESIGPRSTLVRSRDNSHTIVPNSRLLEENVVNLTLSDNVIRTRIPVGVAYGSPTREVERLLEEVLGALDGVMKEPAPLVVFNDFGESALHFEASFWSALEGRKDLESELRHRIAEAFATAGILMAFPQRDVHLGTSRPLQIEVVGGKTLPLATPAAGDAPPA
jgi:small-conductance mechanosensitive channel